MSTDPAVSDREVFAVVERFGLEAAFERYSKLADSADASARALHQLLAGWAAVEKTEPAEVERRFAQARTEPRYGAWADVGEALLSLRIKNFHRLEQLLNSAEPRVGDDRFLAGTIAHIRGSKSLADGKHADARAWLLTAARSLGDGNYAYGRVLDTLANLFVNLDDFLTAKLLFVRALEHKTRVDDRHGMAWTNGGLGRLHLNWGYFDRAERYFLADLRLVEELRREHDVARMHGALGQVHVQAALAAWYRGQAAVKERARHKAVDWLTMCIERAERNEYTAVEAFARKDLALALLVDGNTGGADEQALQARELFSRLKFAEGESHVERVRGMISTYLGNWDDARTRLHSALAHFLTTKDRAEVAYTRLLLARLAVRSGASKMVVEQALDEALRTGEICRRTSLIREVEEEFRNASPAAYWNQLFRRVRGRFVEYGAQDFIEGTRETATVFYLDLQGWSNFSHNRDPEEVMMTINQLMADAADVLRRYEAQSISWRGDGFLALVRGPEHARRAVETALDLVAAIAAFNEPRKLLGLPEFFCRIGVSTGEVMLGNVGTYEKMDYSGVGEMMNLGARLEAKAEVSKPCISKATYELVCDQFQYVDKSPRLIDAKGIGEQWVWDVVGRSVPR